MSTPVQRTLVLLLAVAMQLCCCKISSILPGRGCDTESHGDRSTRSCCQESDDGDAPVQTTCACDLNAIKFIPIHGDDSIAAPVFVALVPMEWINDVATNATSWVHPSIHPPDRPSGRLALDRWSRRLI